MQYDIVIIGGGAAGLYLANALVQPQKFGFSTKLKKRPQILLLEGQEQLGKKILATGNGRCNLGNVQLSPQDFHAPKSGFIADILAFWPVQQVRQVWQNLGLPLYEEQGRLYPLSQRASSVRYTLTRYLKKMPNLQIELNAKVQDLKFDHQTYKVYLEDGRSFSGKKVILATGGLIQPSAPDLGEKSIALAKACSISFSPELKPSLVALHVKQMPKRLAGIRVKASAELYHLPSQSIKGLSLNQLSAKCLPKALQAQDKGEIQLTDYGLSGIPIMSIARYFKAGETVVCLDFCPHFTQEEWQEMALQDLADFTGHAQDWGQNFFHENLIKQLCQTYFGQEAMNSAHSISSAKWQDFFALLKKWPFQITSPKEWKHAQVMCGGCLLTEFNADLEHRSRPNLFVAGELLDVDGICGGYNLHWAWSSAAKIANRLLLDLASAENAESK